MAYRGSDLNPEFKKFFYSEKKRISKILNEIGCTIIIMDYGFYCFSGFFTSKSGQIYYFIVNIDQRPTTYQYITYRKAKDYKDYAGGSNQRIDKNEIKNINLL